jgi:hypothetical protein
MEENKREYLSTERSPVIDPELRDLLPPITDDEKAALTADILKNGCYSPMICMADMTLVDGHHRYDICTEHDIPYRMAILDFEDKLDAMQWMVNTQKGRRNLTTYQLGQIALKLKDEIESRAKERQGTRNDLVTTLSESEKRTARKEMADAVGIGEVTMGKMLQIDESAPAPIKKALEKNDISVNQAYNAVKNLEAVPEEEREDEAERMVMEKDFKRYSKRVDGEGAIAQSYIDGIGKPYHMEVSEENARIWMEYAHISVGDLVLEVDAIDGALENLALLKEIIAGISKPKLVGGTQNEIG